MFFLLCTHDIPTGTYELEKVKNSSNVFILLRFQNMPVEHVAEHFCAHRFGEKSNVDTSAVDSYVYKTTHLLII